MARKYAELADNFEKKTNVAIFDEISRYELSEGGNKNSESEQDSAVQQNMIEGTVRRKSAGTTPVEEKSSTKSPKNSSGAREEISMSKLGSVGDILERAKAASKTRR